MARERFDHAAIERKWQERWEQERIYRATEDGGKEKSYVLDMFPYPSGEGLHVGHPKGYIATDIYARHERMQGKEVLHPMGWDAFGLPAENYAIKTKTHPRVAVEKNIATFKAQLAKIGFDYDWSREINTTDPAYYKWTQWIFLKLLEHGLAYQSDEPINWCPSCMTGLANEDLDGGVCERCGTPVVKKTLPQWVLKITDYADRLLKDLDTLDWPEHIKESQRNWIGRSEGAEIDFPVGHQTITVFTTRPDTIYGATYLVLAPEHPLLPQLAARAQNAAEIRAYGAAAAGKSEIERSAEGKEKTGVELKGVKAINPATKEEIPIFVADYVLGGYGTGAIMAVPAHDERDKEFAVVFSLPVKEAGMATEDELTALGAKKVVRYKIRDWVFSRQRYWGEPIPVIHCPKDGVVPVPYEDLPVKLPEVERYEPSGTGESPLAAIGEWVNVQCPRCGEMGKRETNTMPQWAGSSWYYLRFMDPHNDDELVSGKCEKYWEPVDQYVGGAEHATRHLIYARFWHKFLYDIAVVSAPEPFARLHSVGLIIAEDGRKMSKRFGNVINPDDVVAEYGADAFRIYEMFMGPFENTVAWSTASIKGAERFVERVWRMTNLVKDENAAALGAPLAETIKKVGEDIKGFKFNTAISAMMIFANAVEKEGAIGKAQWKSFLQILAPFAPHLTEELWAELGEPFSIHTSAWPSFDEPALAKARVELVVQVGGRRRGSILISPAAGEAEAVAEAIQLESVAKALGSSAPSRVVYVPGRILNLVP
jgi:leucyl-tRNA synthetase